MIFFPSVLCSALNSTILGLCAPRRPLKPRQRERKKVTQDSSISGVNIIIRVVRAFNVPLRIKELESSPGQYQNVGEFDDTPPIVSDKLVDARKAYQVST